MSFYALKAAATRARSLAWARRARREDEPGLRILFYHRISHDPDELAVGRRAFRQHMDYLATESYRVVDVLEAVDLLDSGEPVPRAIGLSFDDGYLDVAEEALPLLSERGFRATVFVPPAVVDGWARFTWYETQPPLSVGRRSSSWTGSARSASRPTRSRIPTCSRCATPRRARRSWARRRRSRLVVQDFLKRLLGRALRRVQLHGEARVRRDQPPHDHGQTLLRNRGRFGGDGAGRLRTLAYPPPTR